MEECRVVWPDVLAIATTGATTVIALFTIAMFVLQFRQHQHDKKVANAKYKFALFDKRLQVYYTIEKFIREFWKHGRPTMDATRELRFNARTAHFLFPKQVLSFVDELVEKGFVYERAKAA